MILEQNENKPKNNNMVYLISKRHRLTVK